MRPLTALLLLTLGPRLVQALPPLPQPETDRLICQLGSDRLVEREAASQKLEGRGWHARAALLKAAKDSDVERRARARRLLLAMEARFQGQVRAMADAAWWLAEPAVAPVQRRIKERQLAQQREVEVFLIRVVRAQADGNQVQVVPQVILRRVQRRDAVPVKLKLQQRPPTDQPTK